MGERGSPDVEGGIRGGGSWPDIGGEGRGGDQVLDEAWPTKARLYWSTSVVSVHVVSVYVMLRH